MGQRLRLHPTDLCMTAASVPCKVADVAKYNSYCRTPTRPLFDTLLVEAIAQL